jgi:hypothetical protein
MAPNGTSLRGKVKDGIGIIIGGSLLAKGVVFTEAVGWTSVIATRLATITKRNYCLFTALGMLGRNLDANLYGS